MCVCVCYLYQLNEPSLEASNIISPFAFKKKKKKNLSQSLISPQISFIVLVKIILVLFSRI